MALQSVAQLITVTGGSSDLFDVQGGSIQFKNNRCQAALGAGQISGSFTYGAMLRCSVENYRFTLGDSPIPINLPTDVFNSSHYFLTRGLAVDAKLRRMYVSAFAGVSAIGQGTVFFDAAKASEPTGALFVDFPFTEKLHGYSRNIFSSRQTSIHGLEWKPSPSLQLSGAAGIGSNQSYSAVSLQVHRERLSLDAAFIGAGDRFRRISIVSPIVAEVDRENVRLTLKRKRSMAFTVGHQNLLQPQSDLHLPFLRASLNEAGGSANAAGFNFGAALYQSVSEHRRNIGEALYVSRRVASWLEAGGNYGRTSTRYQQTTSILSGRIRQILSPRISLLELVNHSAGHTTASFGGSYEGNCISLNVDYSTIFVPFGVAHFQQSLVFTFRVRPVMGLTFNGQTFVTPEGTTKYTVYGTGVLSPGSNLGAWARSQEYHLQRFIVRGRVVTVEGQPVSGAAVRIGKDLIVTNSSGEFFLRKNKSGTYTFEVDFAEFQTAAPLELVSAPVQVKADRDEASHPITVVLRSRR